ncbi:hypothetical protein PTTG_25383 [Puccinia triticina 1-1 BBBD Race 1]|uniref:Uncharacterized protein n=1 Tax=Puccinia triticina (isolate 1-1 / race 1 (BBBD)) TaxID=630390 RepID=A0A180H381_PUCT1|nr:hypothetical protein PTTG_25383 [Puccinia triticina 1-1 BBBD Race 1]WAR57689.1 hypothetical protein PtB15_8B742 [Puccinia triticina]
MSAPISLNKQNTFTPGYVLVRKQDYRNQNKLPLRRTANGFWRWLCCSSPTKTTSRSTSTPYYGGADASTDSCWGGGNDGGGAGCGGGGCGGGGC